MYLYDERRRTYAYRYDVDDDDRDLWTLPSTCDEMNSCAIRCSSSPCHDVWSDGVARDCHDASMFCDAPSALSFPRRQLCVSDVSRLCEIACEWMSGALLLLNCAYERSVRR